MILIKNGNLFTMETEESVISDVLLKNGKISKISKNIEATSEMEVIDARNKNVFPGFIDAHSHIGICEDKTSVQVDESNEDTTPVTPTIRGIDAINPMDGAFHNAIASGITSVMVGPGSANPIGGQFAFIKTHGRCIDEMVVLAPSAIKIAFGENPMNCYGMNGNMPSSRMGTASVIREELFRAKQYFENENSGEKDFNLDESVNTDFMFTTYLYNIVKRGAVSDKDHDYSKKISEVGYTSGKFYINDSIDDEYPVYYYRGIIDNNNVFN